MSILAVSPVTLSAIVITLSFAAGLNVYATVFSLGAMARLHWIVLPDGLESLSNVWIMVVSGVLFAVEVFADMIGSFACVSAGRTGSAPQEIPTRAVGWTGSKRSGADAVPHPKPRAAATKLQKGALLAAPRRFRSRP